MIMTMGILKGGSSWPVCVCVLWKHVYVCGVGGAPFSHGIDGDDDGQFEVRVFFLAVVCMGVMEACVCVWCLRF